MFGHFPGIFSRCGRTIRAAVGKRRPYFFLRATRTWGRTRWTFQTERQWYAETHPRTTRPRSVGVGLRLHGAGCGLWPATDRAQAVNIIRAAFERGVTFFDTAEAYGPFTNEQLLGEAVAPFAKR
jgi:Aldo/keto reductase family